MSDPVSIAAAKVIAPPARSTADGTHQHGPIFRVAHSQTSAVVTAAVIPKECRGRYWRLLSLGANVNWAWVLDEDGNGTIDTAPTLVYGQLTATGTGNAAAAGTLLDSQPEHVWCPPNALGVVSISSAAAATGTWFEAQISGAKAAGGAQ